MDTALSVARRSAGLLSGLAATGAGVAFLALFLLNITQMAMRTFAGGGWIWVTDLSQLLFIWMVMLGTVAAYHMREHIVVDFLVTNLSGMREVVVAAVVRAFELGLFAFLFTAGMDVTRNRAGISYIQLGVPTSWGFAALPVAALLLILVGLTLPLRFERVRALDDIEPVEGEAPDLTPEDPDREEPG